MDSSSRPLFRLARDLLARRDASTGPNREAAQSDLDAAFDAIEEHVDALVASVPEPSLAERFPNWGQR